MLICAYTMGRLRDIDRALASVAAQQRRPDELILVIDHKEELFVEATRRYPDATVVPNTSDRGLSGARNSGVAAASSDVIAFLDDDAEAAPDWIQRLLAHYSDPAVVGVGGTSEAVWHSGRPAWFPDEFDWVVGCSYRGLPTTAGPIRNLIGSNMSFRRSTFELAGGFHGAIGRIGVRPVGCEETEFCIRATRQIPGVRIIYDPAARVRHHLPASRSEWGYFARRCFAEGLSKAIVAELAGPDRGLSSERSYALRVLPRGVIRGLGDAVRTGSVAPVGRSMSIIAGLLITAAGYLYAMGRRWWNRSVRRARPLPPPPQISPSRS